MKLWRQTESNWIVIFLGLGLSALNMAFANEPQGLEKARWLFQKNETEKALQFLQQTATHPPHPTAQSLASAYLGVYNLEKGNPAAAVTYLSQATQSASPIEAYIWFWLGDSQRKLGSLDDAKRSLQKALTLSPSQELQNNIRLSLAELAISQKRLSEAKSEFVYLERKWRGSIQVPLVLYKHLQSALLSKDEGLACRLARRLFSQYPQNPLVADWSIDLKNAHVDGMRLGCLPSEKEQAQRIRRLQLAGETDRARQEIEQLGQIIGDKNKEKVDFILAQFLTSEGFPADALQILIKYYPTHSHQPSYLNHLARAASRAGEFQTAVGLYQRIHDSSPQSRAAKEALFQSGFLSYQFQDYDGATRRFQKFLQLYPGSGLAKEARWNLAWIRYLRGDYETAYQKLTEISLQKRRGKIFRDERSYYWAGMSLLKLGDFQKARRIFKELQSPQTFSFYSLAAQARETSLPKETPQDEKNLDRSLSSLPAVSVEVANEEAGAAEAEAGSSLEDVADAEGAEEGNSDSDSESGSEIWGDFKDPRLKKRFDAAQVLISMGQSDWARFELFEIERHTRQPFFLKQLIKNYESLGSFHRSVIIADNSFLAERINTGLVAGRALWESAFPRAFKGHVEKYAKNHDVTKEFVWSIMKAESQFRSDVLSPVGAKGLLQLMPYTARRVSKLMGQEEQFQVMSLLNPEVNIKIGTRYMQRLKSLFTDSLPLMAAAYNAGPHRVESWLSQFGHLDADEFIEHVPFIETRNYMKKVTKHFAIYGALYNNSSTVLPWLAQSIPVKMDRRPATREIWED